MEILDIKIIDKTSVFNRINLEDVFLLVNEIDYLEFKDPHPRERVKLKDSKLIQYDNHSTSNFTIFLIGDKSIFNNIVE
jgi:hypothetical protein